MVYRRKRHSRTRVTRGNWYSCYEDFFKQDLSDHYESIEAAVQGTYDNWWSKAKEEKYGCLIIKIKEIDIEK
jgi:ASC-1-like (ASCH) protein